VSAPAGKLPDTAPNAGIRLVDKAAGVSSHDVVATVRRELGRTLKVGHAGTLDPFATGLLLVLLGRATRVQRFVMALPKRYEVVARFGAISNTGDPEGEIVLTGVVPDGDLPLPVGALRQRPPAFSAVKVQGRRAYDLARRGERFELAERTVNVYRFEETWRERDRRGFLIECSSGTYVRSLIAGLGDAYCLSLRRTAIGPFEVSDAGDRVLGLEEALSFLPAVRLDETAGRAAAHGRPVHVGDALWSSPGPLWSSIEPEDHEPALEARDPAWVRLLDPSGLVCIARLDPDGIKAHPAVGLRG
jgi:tRNA pseudouridine55 synthase